MEGYQASAVVWLLTRLSEDSVAGPMLSDDMGLGKTFTMIATIVVHYYLQTLYEEVKKSWSTRAKFPGKRPAAGLNHNAVDAPLWQACPAEAAITKKYGLQCPCVVGSTARGIAQHMSNLPSLILCPSKGVSIWIDEWEKFVNTDPAMPASKMRFYVHVNRWSGPQPKLADFCKDMEAAQQDDVQSTYQVEEGVLYRPRYDFDGGSGNVLVTTTESLPGLQTERKPGTNNAFFSQASDLDPAEAAKVEGWQVSTVVPVAGCGVLVMDEIHEYKGSTTVTQPFHLLYKFRHQEKPTLAVGLSGNAFSSGPDGWKRLVTHTQNSIKRHHLEAKLGRLQTGRGYERLTDDWNYVQRNIDTSWLAQLPDELKAVQEEVDQRKARIRTDFQQGIVKMIIRRQKKDTFRDVKVLDIAAPITTWEKCRIPNGPAWNALSDCFKHVQQWMNHLHEEEMRKWRNSGQEGPKPVLAKAQQGVLRGGPQNKSNAAHHAAFRHAILAMTFPEGAGALEGLAKRFTDVTLKPSKTERSVLSMMKESLFFAYRTAMGKNGSPKFARLLELVKEQLLDTRLDKLEKGDQPDNGPTDGSFVRHMVVFADNPLTAYLTALFLQVEFRKEVEVTLIHRTLFDRAYSAHTPWNSRHDAFTKFGQDCAPESKNKILVGTYQLIATMRNFQRASSAVLLDIPTSTQRDQARDRIYRRGQPCAAQITEMWYENHVYEHHRRERNIGTEKMGGYQLAGVRTARARASG
ncbi:hypothetical protein PG997_011629 [Apiospora hydei]|uniref:SNF2 N-terminal domain-containing protein n=1 Tax=Apiospora hydei TaxID=1337664 RepID=A0ABR1VJK7_9PEZI